MNRPILQAAVQRTYASRTVWQDAYACWHRLRLREQSQGHPTIDGRGQRSQGVNCFPSPSASTWSCYPARVTPGCFVSAASSEEQAYYNSLAAKLWICSRTCKYHYIIVIVSTYVLIITTWWKSYSHHCSYVNFMLLCRWKIKMM